ncbi:MAG: DUF927 domain-containing protein [Holosporaceae bacterium]|jgi:hypothetical protein|nr:DUF927 domain-containing protein [Holosporaceae bacterium]
MKTNFKLNSSGVFYQNNEGMKIKICDAVEVLAIVSNLDATQWGKLIEFTNAHKQKRNLIVPMKLLMSSSRHLTAELSLRGLIISLQYMRLFQEYLCGKNPQKIMVMDYQFLGSHAFFTNFSSVESEAIITERLKTFIIKNMENFYDIEGQNFQELLRLVGYVKRVDGKTYYCIFQKIFEREITNNRDEMQILVDGGLLVPRINGDFYHFHNFCKVYIIESNKL